MISTSYHIISIKLHFVIDIFTRLIGAPYTTNVTALNRGTPAYLMTLLGIFDILTQQEIAKGKLYVCQCNCLKIVVSHC